MPVLPLNTIVWKYRIDDLAGVGGMGEVYRAVHIQNGTVVAIKSLNNDPESGAALAPFKNEAIIRFNLRHPNVAARYEYVDYPGHPCIAMEFVEGQTLQRLVRLGTLAGVCDAAAYMHLKGVLHRDIKSENIWIAPDGKARLPDFGIAAGKSTLALTRARHVAGTLQNLAPEQIRGLRSDARSDVWAFQSPALRDGDRGFAVQRRRCRECGRELSRSALPPASELKHGIPRRMERLISGCLLAKPAVRRGLQPAFGMVWIGLREMPGLACRGLRVPVATLLAGYLLIGLLTRLERPVPVSRPSTMQRLPADTGMLRRALQELVIITQF